ncbi:MAG TPA: hypothetical protein VGD45_20530 [Steroidobacter sp.]|uniref:hypothetical protein n=1 Tax=Steroidobacter sp. TaxID=1978227 RepID=UPI002EDA4EF5
MNGDQLQHEIDNAGVPLDQRSDYPYCSFDAEDWAKAFVLQNPGFDIDLARAWFAAALMRGYDQRSGTIVHEFLAWLSGDIPELHIIEAPKLLESWVRFKAKRAEGGAQS